jgi:hypothetical protein
MGFIKLQDEVWKRAEESDERRAERVEEQEQRDRKRQQRIKLINDVLKFLHLRKPNPSGAGNPPTSGAGNPPTSGADYVTDSIFNFLSERGKELKTNRLEFIYSPVNKVINKDASRQFHFTYRAGHWYGSRPKPDTHVVSCTVDFEEMTTPTSATNTTPTSATNTSNSFQESVLMEMSIFPSLTGMMLGTIIGGFLGTVAGNTTKNFLSWQWAGVLLSNLILSFIAGVILMRRKDVQSFITIEDLWGGVLIGFIVGYAGFQNLLRLLGPPLPPH